MRRPLIWLLTCLMIGCGGHDGPERFSVSGTVTFHGKPVPAGYVYFTPDASRGNKGPQGYAEINNGRYTTAASGKGTVGGPHKVRISGFDGIPVQGHEQMLEKGRPLFTEYETTVDLPKESTAKDFAVP